MEKRSGEKRQLQTQALRHTRLCKPRQISVKTQACRRRQTVFDFEARDKME